MKPSRTGQSRRVSWKNHLSQGLVKETHDKTEQYTLLRWKENTMKQKIFLIILSLLGLILIGLVAHWIMTDFLSFHWLQKLIK